MSTEHLDFSGYTLYAILGEELWLEDPNFDLVHDFTKEEVLRLRDFLNNFLETLDGQD